MRHAVRPTDWTLDELLYVALYLAVNVAGALVVLLAFAVLLWAAAS